MTSMRGWLGAAETAPETRRGAGHNAVWHWPGGDAER
jgi:hypothetical protein